MTVDTAAFFCGFPATNTQEQSNMHKELAQAIRLSGMFLVGLSGTSCDAASVFDAAVDGAAGSPADAAGASNRPIDLLYVSGSGQQGSSGEQLPDSLVVRVIDRSGAPMADVEVNFSVTGGGGLVSPESVLTDSGGRARSAWTLGFPGAQEALAQASEAQPLVKQLKDSVVTFSAHATAATAASLRIQPDTAVVDTGATQQFDAARVMSDGSLQPATVTWSATGGSIDAAGLFTGGTATGTFAVTATDSLGLTDTATVIIQDGGVGGVGGGVPIFGDDFESGDLSRSGGGFSWSNEYQRVFVGDLVARSGSQSLTFFWKSHLTSDGWANAELRFKFPEVQELWSEFYVYFPDGTEPDGAGGTLNKYVKGDSPGNDKFFTFWNSVATYSGPVSGNFSIWNSNGNGAIRAAWWDPSINDQRVQGNGMFVAGDPDLGRWIQVRLHVRIGDPGRSNAVYQFWKDGALIVNLDSVPSYDAGGTYTRLDRGYLLGWANDLLSSGMYGFPVDTYIFLDDFAFYTSDPQWQP